MVTIGKEVNKEISLSRPVKITKLIQTYLELKHKYFSKEILQNYLIKNSTELIPLKTTWNLVKH